ncbi:MAG: PHB depolymerase family esterase [Planctomycetota bacterium]
MNRPICLWVAVWILATVPAATAQTRFMDHADREPSAPWKASRELPSVRSRTAAAATDAGVFLFGGRDQNGPLDEVWRYDPELDLFEARRPLPIPMYGMAAATHGQAIVLAGGHDGTRALRSVWLYLPDTDQYVPLAPMKLARSEAAAEILGDRLWVLGGFRDDGATLTALDLIESYFLPRGSWQLESIRLSVARGAIGHTVLEGRLYLLGGSDAQLEPRDVFEVFDPSGGTISMLSSPHGVPRSGVTLFTANGEVVAAGGFGGTWASARGSGVEIPASHNGVQHYDVDQDSWGFWPNMTEARSFAASASYEGMTYVFGGVLRFGDIGRVVKERPIASTERFHPSRLPRPAAPRGSGGSGGPLGESDFTIQAFGLTRQYRLVVPTSYDPAQPTRLALFMHGSSDQNVQFQKDIGMDALAEQFGFIACYPQAVDGEQHSAVVLAWEWHDWRRQNNLDIELVLTMIEDIAANYNIDRERITISGFSAGGFFTYLAGTHHGDTFAAATPIAGGDSRGFTNGQPTLVHPNPYVVQRQLQRRTPMLFVHGDIDINVKFEASLRAQSDLRAAGWSAQKSGLIVIPRQQHLWNRNLNTDLIGFLSQWTVSGR